MSNSSTIPSVDPDEAAVLEQLDKVEAAARAKPTARVVKRALDLALRLRALEAFARTREKVAESSEPDLTLDEINAEIGAARAERKALSRSDRYEP